MGAYNFNNHKCTSVSGKKLKIVSLFFFSLSRKHFFYFIYFFLGGVKWQRNKGLHLLHECLDVAFFSSVTGVAATQSSGIITSTTARAVTSFRITVTAQWIGLRGAFNHTAIWTTESIVAFAAVVVLGVPGGVVLCCHVLGGVIRDVITGHFFQTLTCTVSGAIVRAGRSTATFTPESIVAGAFTTFTVASAFARTFDQLFVVVVELRGGGPRVSRSTGTQRTISPCPSSFERGGAHDTLRGSRITVVVGFTAREAAACVL